MQSDSVTEDGQQNFSPRRIFQLIHCWGSIEPGAGVCSDMIALLHYWAKVIELN